MYVPAVFAENDTAKLHEFIRRNGFALLVSQGAHGLMASPLPFLLDASAGPSGVLLGHMARANPHWRDVLGEVMVVFSGPHAYVSPSWYEEAESVPTWNYVTVHAYGIFQLVEDRATLLRILRESVQVYEDPRGGSWTLDESTAYFDRMLHAIVGFEITISRLEGKWKLSQNQPEIRRRRVELALSARPDENSQAIAAHMRENLCGDSE
jgi:transcriptional regulator